MEGPMSSLEALGWGEELASHFEPLELQGLWPARVAAEHRHIYRLYTLGQEVLGGVSGRFRYEASERQDFPVTGDWAAIEPPQNGRTTLQALLPRRSYFSRKVAGRATEQQLVAANFDTVFIVAGLDRDFNPRRIERTLILARESGAPPVILLNKADLGEDVEERTRQTHVVAPGVPVHVVSSLRNEGLGALAPYFGRGQTVALLGSSGVGKSTLVNRLLGEDRQRIQPLRESDGRGQHATTYRELLLLPGGGVIIDTPGMRELQLWASEEGFAEAFEDIESLARRCGFRDCSHQEEPRCAVTEAAQAGSLPWDRLENYRKMKAELRYLELRQDAHLRLAQKKKTRSIHRLARRFRPRE